MILSFYYYYYLMKERWVFGILFKGSFYILTNGQGIQLHSLNSGFQNYFIDQFGKNEYRERSLDLLPPQHVFLIFLV